MNLKQLRETGNFVSIETLYNWGQNFDNVTNPFAVFLDLVGYTDEYFGTKLAAPANNGYLELDFIADALKEYVVRPDDAQTFIQALLDSEIVEGNECDECGITHDDENKKMSFREEGGN